MSDYSTNLSSKRSEKAIKSSTYNIKPKRLSQQIKKDPTVSFKRSEYPSCKRVVVVVANNSVSQKTQIESKNNNQIHKTNPSNTNENITPISNPSTESIPPQTPANINGLDSQHPGISMPQNPDDNKNSEKTE